MRLLLREDCGADVVDDLAVAQGWQLTNLLPGGPARPAQRIYTAADGETVVYFVTDGRLGIRYALAAGRDAGAAAAAVTPLVAPDDEPTSSLGSLADVGTRRRVARAVLAGAPLPAEVTAVLADALAGPAELQLWALHAIAYAPDPALEPPLRRLAEGETAHRALAQQILALY